MTMLPPDPLFVMHTNNHVTCLLFSDDATVLYSGDLTGKVTKWSLQIMALELFEKNKDFHLLIGTESGDVGVWKTTQQQQPSAAQQTDDGSQNSEECPVDELITKELPSGNISGSEELIRNAESVKCKEEGSVTTEENPATETAISELTHKANVSENVRNINQSLDKSQIVESINKLSISSDRVNGDKREELLWSKCEAVGSTLKMADCVMCMTFDVVRMRGAAAGPGSSIVVFGVSAAGVTSLRIISLPSPGVGALSVRADSRLVAAGCWDGSIRLVSWKSMINLAVLRSHDSGVQDLTHSASTPYILAAACKDGRISLWSLYNGQR